ncbi:MAG TPA: PQQ-binding-like beta-propeller repeat protein, partial [Dehalococcoidia bacterium]|nr:PQQ-binding-like beta-propeller repeat protein [Dehalococcoidia bacterium]
MRKIRTHAILASGLALGLAALAVVAGAGTAPAATPPSSGPSATRASEAPAVPRRAYADAPGDWPMFHHDAARTGYNADETVLQPPLRLKWSYATGGAVRTSPAVTGRTVYVVAEDKALYLLDAQTGVRKPSYQGNAYAFSGSPALAGGVLYQGADDGSLYALDAASGRTLWTYLTGSPVRSTPAVTGGTVYFTSGTKLYALDAQTGALRWSYTTGNPIYASPAVADGVVYALFSKPPPAEPYAATTSEMVALDAATGGVRWTVSMPY